MVMPEGLTGLELSRRLRKESPALRIIIMSGYSLELSLHGGLAKNRLLYLQKPFEPGALANMVRQSLDTGDIAA
jgi:CheY-like chemotaxis protein